MHGAYITAELEELAGLEDQDGMIHRNSSWIIVLSCWNGNPRCRASLGSVCPKLNKSLSGWATSGTLQHPNQVLEP
jgi:hypothetical protein